MTDRRRALWAVVSAALGTVAWVAGVALVARHLAATNFGLHRPWLAKTVVMSLALVGGVGGLWGFWNVTWTYPVYRRGYRLRWIRSQECVYEELGSDDMFRTLAFGHRALAAGYAPPCRVSLPTSDNWEVEAPAWAHGRRGEIVERITEWLQRGDDPAVTFVAPGELDEEP